MGQRAAAAMPPLPTQGRLDSLTGLRYFGALAVFVTHFVGSGNSGYGRIPLIYPQSTFGPHGVTFFFVLSGFVLTWMWTPGRSTGVFYWRRVARIMPLHIVTTVLALWVFYEPMSRQDFELGPYLLSLVLLQAWVHTSTRCSPATRSRGCSRVKRSSTCATRSSWRSWRADRHGTCSLCSWVWVSRPSPGGRMPGST